MAKQKHYINNEAFLNSLIDYKEACKLAKKEKKPPPAIPNYIGECFMKIAEGLSHKPNFINYTYRDEMMSDGIETVYNTLITLIRPSLRIHLPILHKSSTLPFYEESPKRRNKPMLSIKPQNKWVYWMNLS